MQEVKVTGRSKEPSLTAPCPALLQIQESDLATVVSHLQSTLPEEGCGFLAGRSGKILAVFPVENNLHSSTRFNMAARPMVAALTTIIEKKWQLSAVYHSHPAGPARLSATDLANLNYREALQIVVSLQDPKSPVFGVFCVTNEQIREIPLQIV